MKNIVTFEQLGTIKAYNADCMQIMQQYPDKYFDLAIVDPPYGINRFKNNQPSRLDKYGSTGTANNEVPDEEYVNELFRVSKNQIIWGYNHLSKLLPTTKEFIFWYKRQPVQNYSKGELAWTSFDRTAKYFDYAYYGNINANPNRIHPTEKPIKLYEWLLMNYAKQGDKILDTHGGSMSHAIASHNLGFDLVIIEKDKDYYDAAIKRLKCHLIQQVLQFD